MGELTGQTFVGPQAMCDIEGLIGIAVPADLGACLHRLVAATEQSQDLAALRVYLAARLPDYARPLFLRIRDEIEVTGTFKQKKLDLAREGFDPERTGDAIFFDDPRERALVRLDGALYAKIVAGAVRL